MIWALLIAIGIVAAVAAYRTLRDGSRQISVTEARGPEVDPIAVAGRLAEVIRIPTITHQDREAVDSDAFLSLHAVLRDRFPAAHAALEREIVAEYSLLYTWPGRDESLPPTILTAHLDVVPADDDPPNRWTYPPFEGAIADGFVWGRGALDDKNAVIAILDAVERLVGEGYRPERTLLLAFGHDEEAGGYRGAAAIVDVLLSRGIRAAFVLDEGFFVTDGLVPGVDAPVALIGTSEKGSVTLELTTTDEPGHTSMPPAETVLGRMSAAVARLESNPMPTQMGGIARDMFTHLAPEMGIIPRAVFSNLWLTRPLVRRRFARTPTTNAIIRTTTAVTILEGGVKENVLPGHARAVVNFRILPGDSVEGVVRHVKNVIGDQRINVSVLPGASGPAPISPAHGAAYELLHRTIRSVFPGVLVAPSLVIARTDARHYVAISDHVYRFSPVWLRREDLGRLHGIDERIPIDELAQSVRFYYHLIRSI